MSVIRCKIPSNSVEWSDPNGSRKKGDFEMGNYIMLDGRKFEIDEKNSLFLRAVVSEEKKKKENSFARVLDEDYYFITSYGDIDVDNDSNSFIGGSRHRVANYCTDVGLMRQRALHETLNRLLWRYREICGKDGPWDGEHQHWYIMNRKGEFTVDFTMTHHIQGVIYFSLCDNAVDAIDNVVVPFMKEHPDFVW